MSYDRTNEDYEHRESQAWMAALPPKVTAIPEDTDLSSEPLIRIVCAANRHKSGLIICGARHYDQVMRAAIKALNHGDVDEARCNGFYSCEEGFITNKGEYVSRELALRLATAAGQVRRRTGGAECKQLYSEDLY